MEIFCKKRSLNKINLNYRIKLPPMLLYTQIRCCGRRTEVGCRIDSSLMRSADATAPSRSLLLPRKRERWTLPG